MPDAAPKRVGPQLAALEEQVLDLFVEIIEGTTAATAALVAGDPSTLHPPVERERVPGVLQRQVERAIEAQFARYAPMGSDFRYLVTVLRVVPELERSTDLVAHITKRAYLKADLSPPVVATVSDMGHLTAGMWRTAADAWGGVDPDAAAILDTSDDRIDYLTATLPGLLAAAGAPARVAMELALVGRFYERLADHAVHIASRIRWLATGGLRPADD